MFDESLYQADTVAKPLKEGDPLYNYEIKGWDLGPRIYKILGISAAINLVALAIGLQGSLLTMKGCDSPLVGTMCQALDTIYVGSMVFGTDREYVDAAYDKTDLGDVDITYVDVTGLENQKLYYPANYFQIANPEKYMIDPATGEMIAAMPSPDTTYNIPGIPNGLTMSPPPSASGNSLFDTKPHFPKANPNPIEGDSPKGVSQFGSNPIGPNKKRGGGKVSPDADPEGTIPGFPNTTAQAKPSPSPTVEPTAPVADVELNKRPFVDLGNTVNDLLEKKQVDLATPFLINATGKLDKDGRLDPKSFRWVKAESPDPKMLEVVKEAIEAMNASNYLQYLSMVDVKNVTFTIQQDNDNVTALVESQFDNDLRPKTVSTLLTAYINKKKESKAAPDASQNDKDDLLLLQNASVTPQGKKIVIQFTIPKANIQQMIQRKLAEQKADPKQPNSSGTTANPTQNTARN